ncbi:unnamed protein product [Haemonchus placei]|uniref:UV-stimulated scaffold protein A n=1 Tax=Haemonchus placei TaxID=6290 RepID=A0A0N4VSP5_HAEPC|nr:unnamed protein product [Haemonchus placei]
MDDSSRILRIITNKLVNEAVSNSKKAVSTDSQEFKKLKKVVRENENAIAEYVEYLFVSLKRSDSERRQSLMSVFDYFFNRSHNFRLRTVDKLQELLLLVCETDPLHHPLPGPTTECKELKAYALKTVKQWHEKFGPGYVKLNFVGDFLRESKAIDFDSASAELLAERMRKEAENRRSAELSQKIAASVRRKFDQVKDDIERCIASADTALSILVPLFCVDSEENEAKNRDAASCRDNDQIQEMQTVHGYTSSETISVVLPSLTPEVTVNEDNEALIENLRDAKVMLDVYRKKIFRCTYILLPKSTIPYSLPYFSWQRKLNGAVGVELLMRDLTAINGKIEQRCGKIAELNLKPKRRKRKGADSSESEESDLEEVPEKQLEDFMPPDEVPRHIMERVQQLENGKCSEQPCCSKSLVTTSSVTAPKEDEVKPKPDIPVVSFGLDLKYWGEAYIEPTILRNNADCHPFWRAPEDDDRPALNEKGSNVGEVRLITWIGEPQRAERRCKARLPNGKLCPRMDLRKCPLHGIIVDRDDEGFPLEELDTTEMSSSQADREHQEEEEYLRDLEAATGKSFVSKPKKKKVRESTVRERLEKKLLNPRTIKRVSAALDAARKARLQKKFGDQFAHSFSK